MFIVMVIFGMLFNPMNLNKIQFKNNCLKRQQRKTSTKHKV